MTDEILDEFVCVANKAADAAGTVLKEFFWKPKLIQTFNKHDEDGCIVEQATSADLAAEDAMASVILQNFPDHLIFGEERGWLPEERHADFVWVLDPIDGTTSFKNGVPLFGTLIALLHKSKPILGIIDQPILLKRWVGVQGRTTTVDGLPIRTRPCEQLSRSTLYASSPLHFSDEEREAFNRVAEKVQEPIFGAECFTYGLLASGSNLLSHNCGRRQPGPPGCIGISEGKLSATENGLVMDLIRNIILPPSYFYSPLYFLARILRSANKV